MIHYHGPIHRLAPALALMKARHAMISFADPSTIELAAEVCQSFAIDNGAFSFWKRGGGNVNLKEYGHFVEKWRGHPGFDWCIIPDSIDGDERLNDSLISHWFNVANVPLWESVPVWHLHESIERLERLSKLYPRIALGSSGDFSDPGTEKWWERMAEAMEAICIGGIPCTRLHGLRMLNPTIFSQIPLSSADSNNVSRNIGIDSRWDTAAYAPKTQSVRALILADRIESHCSAATWQRRNGIECNLELIG